MQRSNNRLFRFIPCLILVSTMLWLAPPQGSHASPLDADIDQATLFRSPNHFIINNRQMQFELDENPQPFVDFAFVRPGFVEYVHKETKEIVPLGGEHPYKDPDVVRSVPFGVASGIRIRVQPAERGAPFREMIQPTFPWERSAESYTLIYDEAAQLYRAWYRTGAGFAYAESSDLKQWNKPLRNVTPYEDHAKTNLIWPVNVEEALAGVMKEGQEKLLGLGGGFFVDPSAPPEERFKVTFMAHTKELHYDDSGNPTVDRPLSAMTGAGSTVIFGATSADGMAWNIIPRPLVYHDADTLTVTKYDTLQKKYVIYTRLYEFSHRTVGYAETDDFREWPIPVNIMTPGPEDPPSVDFYANSFSFYPGQPQIRMIFCLAYDRSTDSATVKLATSRDGRCFHFTPGGPIIDQAESGIEGHGFLAPKPSLVRAPDGRMIIFYEAFKLPHKFPRYRFRGMEEGSSEFFMAWWPADRMVALEAPEYGEFDTANFILRGDRLMLNMSSHRTGGVQVELRDESFNPIPGRTFADADLLVGDHMEIPITWGGKSDLSELRGKKVYLRFRMRTAKLFSIKAVE